MVWYTFFNECDSLLFSIDLFMLLFFFFFFLIQNTLTFSTISQYWASNISWKCLMDQLSLKFIPWLLMTWQSKEPGHQQPWYCSSSSGIFQFQLSTIRFNPFLHQYLTERQIYGLVQERCNSIANALELHLSCTNPSKYIYMFNL